MLLFSGEAFFDPTEHCGSAPTGIAIEPEGSPDVAVQYEKDPCFPSTLNGYFHGVAADRRLGTVQIFNDRYGLHRLYYHESGDAFYFASEAKALLSILPELRRLDLQSLGEYLSCGCVMENRSLFRGIEVLPPGSSWIARGGSVGVRRSYFSPSEWECQEPLSPEAYYLTLRDAFSRTLPRYVASERPLGLSMTGGLDTRMIMSWWKPDDDSVHCYTFRGMYNDCQDAIVARRVAAIWRQPHHEIMVGRDFLSQFPHFAERTVYASDGCAAVDRAAVLYANQRAAQVAQVRITGNYGSEVLRRMIAFKPKMRAPVFDDALDPFFATAEATYRDALQCHPMTFIAFKQVPWHHFGLNRVEQTELSQRSPYLDNDLVKAAYRAPDSTLVKHHLFTNDELCLRLIADGDARLRRSRTDRGIGNGSPSGVVTRVALETTFKCEYYFDYGMPSWLVKLNNLVSWAQLERLILGRHKYYHFRVWYRDELREYVRGVLLDNRTLSRPFLNGRAVERIVHEHTTGVDNHTMQLSQLLTLELILRSFVDGSRETNVLTPDTSVSLA
jgi:asparagine synthase (glutamine-hydrolysing)